MIVVKNLTRKYGDFTAVNSISFEIPKGEIIGLLGHNGAGKTTTLKMLTGYLEPTAGSVVIDDLDICDHRLEVQRKIGYLSESSPLYPEMTVYQYLDYVAQLRDIPDSRRPEAIKDAIRATDLAAKAAETIDTLSKGYKQRVGVAQAIIHKPEILLLDEPTNGLDPTQIFAMRSLIKELAVDSTVIISTHIMQEVEAICDRVLIVLNGKLAVDSKLEDLQRANNITLTLKQELNEVRSLISSVSGVTEVEAFDQADGLNHFRIKTADENQEITPHIARKVFEKGWDLYHIHREHRNLESVFKEVNRSGGAAHV